MQIDASVTTVENIRVDVNPRNVIKALKNKWLSSIHAPGEYINSNGNWESWEDTGHGSGLTLRFRKATAEEKQIYDSFDLLKQIDFK